jgi:predicted O-methyltransferase YrrM
MQLSLKAYIWEVRRRAMVHLVLWWFGIEKGETQTSEAERDCLARHASGKKNLAEIGVYHGVTTCRLRKAMDPSGILVAVDPYPKQRLGFSAQRIIAQRDVSRIRTGTVIWMRTIGSIAADRLYSDERRNFDFVFIDGDHSYEGLKADWEGWSRLILPGGTIALHDSRSSPGRPIEDWGSVRYTRDVIERDPNFEIVEAVDSLTVLRRCDARAS